MTARLINADKLIDDLSDLKRSPWANDMWMTDQRKLGIREAIDMIQSIVRVDSQTVEAVRHGKWMGTVCSACGESTSFYYDCDYCPNCGARMVKDD